MALLSEANFIIQIEAAADALTTAWNDDTLTGVATEIERPDHPLRRLNMLFSFNPVTGEFKADTDYISAAYAGKKLMKGTRDLQTITPPPA